MSASDTDKREVCPRCGWVGRRAFQEDRHDLCEAPLEDVLPEDGDVDEDEDVAEGVIEKAPPDEEVPRWGRSSARRRGIPSKKTLAVRRITRHELAVGLAELRELGADVAYDRPRTRGDCAQVPRPCPYIACKYSLYLDVSTTGSIILNFPHLEPWEMPAERSCSLDLADQGPMTLEDIAVVTNLTRERIRQIEVRALNRKVRPLAIERGLGDDAAVLSAVEDLDKTALTVDEGVAGTVSTGDDNVVEDLDGAGIEE